MGDHCSERDAITVLRSCLGPEPTKLIEGISTDLKAVWKHLDRNYGNPRVISDTIANCRPRTIQTYSVG